MTLGLTPQQQDLGNAVDQFAGRHAPTAATRDSFDALAAERLPEWWDALLADGFHAAHLPERLGGKRGRLLDAACVLEAAGKALLPDPLLPTVTAGAVALLADPTPRPEPLVALRQVDERGIDRTTMTRSVVTVYLSYPHSQLRPSGCRALGA